MTSRIRIRDSVTSLDFDGTTVELEVKQEPLPPISEEELVRRLPKRGLSLFAQFLLLVIAFLMLLMTVYFVWNFTAFRRFNQGVSELNSAGYATTRKQILANYVVVEPNPGPIWTQAAEAVDTSGTATHGIPFFDVKVPNPPPPGKPWDELESVRALIDRNTLAFELIERAAKSKNTPRYAKWFRTAKNGTKNRSVSSNIKLSRMLSLAAYVHAHDGDVTSVASAFSNGLSVAHSLYDEPSLLSQQVSVHCIASTTQTIDRLIDLDFNDQQLAELQQQIRRFDTFDSLARGMEGETVSAIFFLGAPTWPGSGNEINEDAAVFVEQMLPLLESTKSKDWAEIRNTSDAAVAVARFSPKRFNKASNALQGMKSLVVNKASTQARLSVLDALIATSRFQLKNQSLPESLDQLVPEFLPAIPIDPFSNSLEPILFAATEDGIKIYSRGCNNSDDGGDGRFRTHDTRYTTREPMDIVVGTRSN